ncbi:ArsR/SmtB family transcription factor [Actinokineospora enzanensis]|uniref:ArsR/SmtB family transcription factor n=1 Tax=Actinokineospora enzanensis TaxID=155975 RepID=UPI0003A3E3E7|nr:DUF5937 family protein [Actinokineospora enzanensis]
MHLDSAALARVRLAVSPVCEALAWLQVTVYGRTHPIFGDPGAAARFALKDRDVRLVAGTLPTPTGNLLDLLTPTPPSAAPERLWETQLEQVAATAPEQAAAQVAAMSRTTPEVLDAVESGTFVARVTSGLVRFWSAAMADSWSGLRERLHADLSAKAQVMATSGLGSMLGSLNSRLDWDGAALRIQKSDMEVETHPANLVLVPSALSWPVCLVQLADDAAVYFPANGLGVPRGGDPAAVARLLGPTRAALLRDLEVPRTTTELGRRHGLAVGTVSYHLSVLHDNGLVTRTRDKRAVLYQRAGHS